MPALNRLHLIKSQHRGAGEAIGSSARSAAIGTAVNTLVLCDKARKTVQECCLFPREQGSRDSEHCIICSYNIHAGVSRFLQPDLQERRLMEVLFRLQTGQSLLSPRT